MNTTAGIPFPPLTVSRFHNSCRGITGTLSFALCGRFLESDHACLYEHPQLTCKTRTASHHDYRMRETLPMSIFFQLVCWALIATATFYWGLELGKCPDGNLFWALAYLTLLIAIAGAILTGFILIIRTLIRSESSEFLNALTANLWIAVVGIWIVMVVGGHVGVEFCQ